MNDLISISIPSTPGHLRAARRFFEECELLAIAEESPAFEQRTAKQVEPVNTATINNLPSGLVDIIPDSLDEDDNEGEDNLEIVEAAPTPTPAPPPVASAPAPQKVLKLLPKAGEITLEQFYNASWNDDQLVAEGYAEWEVIAPKPSIPPAPAPSPVPAAPATTAQTAPTPTSSTASRPFGAEVDVEDMPWDKRIHASTKTTIADGTFKLLRGIDKALVEQVRAEHVAAGYGKPKNPPKAAADIPGNLPPHVAFMRKLTAHLTALGPEAPAFNTRILGCLAEHGLSAVADLVKPANAHLVAVVDAALFPAK